MDQLTGVPKVQVFATDIDEAAITTARLGRYPETLLKGLSPKRFQRFFRASQGSFVVAKEIRDLCTFSEHNLVRDPPFSRMELVSCRNLLIYMEANLQAAVIPAFHYSLLPGGILLLGGAESTARHEDLFEPLDKAARIFKRRPGRSPPLNLNMPNADMALQRTVLEASRLPAIEENHLSASVEDKSCSTDGLRAANKSAAHPRASWVRASKVAPRSQSSLPQEQIHTLAVWPIRSRATGD